MNSIGCTTQLASVLMEADAASLAKITFLRNMNHEIRTPLNAIMGIIEILMMKIREPEQLKLLNKSNAAAHNLLELLGNVLDMEQIEEGKMELDECNFDMAALLREIVSLIENRANAKGLSVQLDCDAALPERLLGDATRIKQILINLVGNAVKFTERGGVTLSVQLKSRDAEGVQVLFAVSDTGIGIAHDHIERIFRAFEQDDNSATRVYGGAGLGLAISKSLVDLMGGEIEVSSIPGQGSTFAFTLRLKMAAKEHTRRMMLHRGQVAEQKSLADSCFASR
jgi:signal transduction histidine kinase